jgi:ribonuclease P protein component
MPVFTREERLKSKKTIARLFASGQSFIAYPLRVVWEALPAASLQPDKGEIRPPVGAGHTKSPPSGWRGAGGEALVAISVPKRVFKTAVARNRLKRRIREAYRLNKDGLYAKLAGRRIALMLLYIAKEELSYAEIEAGVKKMIRKLEV